jgi:esterase
MQLNYQSYGKGSPLVILHGLFGMLDNWHTVGKMLGEHFRVFLVDQRNHGRSPHSQEWNYDVMAEDIMSFIAQHQISPCFLLGHSMGGKVAMTVALQYSGQVERLIIIDIAPRSYPSFHDSILETLTSLDLAKYTSRQAVDEALSNGIHDAPVRQFLMKNLARNDDGSFRWKMNLPIIASKYPEILKGIEFGNAFSKPALFVRSTRSSYVVERDLSDIRRLFPRATIVDFETGHWVHAEAPLQLTDTVVDFLNKKLL